MARLAFNLLFMFLVVLSIVYGCFVGTKCTTSSQRRQSRMGPLVGHKVLVVEDAAGLFDSIAQILYQLTTPNIHARAYNQVSSIILKPSVGIIAIKLER